MTVRVSRMTVLAMLTILLVGLAIPFACTAQTGSRGNAPSVTCNLKNPSQFAQGASILVTGTITDDGTIVSVEFTGGGAIWTNITSFYDTGTGTYSWSWDTTTESAGAHQVSIRAKDDENKYGSAALSLTLDGNDPDILIKQPQASQVTLGLGDTILISGDASDSTTSIKFLNISVDGGNEWTDILANLKGKAWTYSWVTKATDPPMLHEVIVQATDTVGHTADAKVSITLSDLKSPTVAITTPADKKEFTEWTTPIQVKGTATDNIGIVTLEIAATAKGQTAKKTNITGRLNSGAWTWNWEAKGIAAGPYTIQLWAKDRKGNTATTMINVTLSDETLPVVTITAPMQGASFTSGDTIIVMGKATDNIKLQKVELIVDGTAPVNISKEVTTSGNYQHALAGVKNGNHQLKVKATDMSGLSQEATVTIKVSPKAQGIGSMAIIGGAVAVVVIVVILVLFIGMKKGWIGKKKAPDAQAPQTAPPTTPPAPTYPPAEAQPVPPGPILQASAYPEYPAEQQQYSYTPQAPEPEPYVPEPLVDKGVAAPMPVDVDAEEAPPAPTPKPLPPPPPKPIEVARPPVPGPPPKKGFQMPLLSKNPQQAPEHCPSCGLDVSYESLVCGECGARLF